MANYNETELVGTRYTRCYEISLFNPLEETAFKTIVFKEQEVVNLDLNTSPFIISGGFCTNRFDPAGIIQMRNPETNALTGQTVSHIELYNILYSLYIGTAIARDDLINNPPVQVQLEGTP